MLRFFSKKSDSDDAAADPKNTPDHIGTDATNSRIKADDILTRREEAFGGLYLINLDDIFKILGGYSSRIDHAIRSVCARAIERHLGDQNAVEIECEGVYVLRLPDADAAQGWAKAKAIVDEIGRNILGERYIPSETQPMIGLAVVDAESLRNEGGNFDGAAAKNALTMTRGKPRADIWRDWQRLVVERKRSGARDWVRLDGTKDPFGADTAWNEIKDSGQKNFLKRKAADRRKARISFKAADRRQSFDRRGRGY